MDSISGNPTQNNPHWRQLLSKRGLSDGTIAHFALRPSIGGWEYPVAHGLSTRRWKAFPNQTGAKYRWLFNKPDALRFYDPNGKLAQNIRNSNGTLILASGEADVWALYEGHITNTTATMLGEGTIPPWLVAELHRLDVHVLQIWPDRDDTGQTAAIKLRDHLLGTGITLEVYELPYELGSKGDIGKLLLDVGADHLISALAACPRQILPHPAPVQKSSPYIYKDTSHDLYEQWCLSIEQAARAAWDIEPPNAKNLSRKNFRSPFRKDEHPSAQWNYTAHGFKDYGTGEFYNTHIVAGLLGLVAWNDYRKDSVPAPLAHKPAPCYFADGIPQKLMSLLLNLHRDTWLNPKRGTLPNLGAGAVTYYVWTELIRLGVLSEREAVTAKSLARDSVHTRQITEDTAQRGLDQLAAWELTDFLRLDQTTQWVGAETPPIPQARRGPKGRQAVLRPLEQALPALLKKLDHYLLTTVLVRDYPDLVIPASMLADVLTEFGLTPEDIAQIDSQCEDLYHDQEPLAQRAKRDYRRRRAIFQTKYSVSALLSDEPLLLAVGVLTPNAAAFRDAVDSEFLERCGGVRTNRYEAARAVGRSLSAHRASCKRRNIVTVPQYEDHELDPDGQGIVAQCEAVDMQAFTRGSMELIAPDGSSTWVSAARAEMLDFDTWLTRRKGERPVMLRVRKPSIEKRQDKATAEEIQAQEEMSVRQRAISQRRKTAFTAEDFAASIWPEAYVLHQGELRAKRFNVTLLSDGRMADRFGEIQDYNARTLWRCLVEPDPAPIVQPTSHTCLLCGAPALWMDWSGWYCRTHFVLPLADKRRLWSDLH